MIDISMQIFHFVGFHAHPLNYFKFLRSFQMLNMSCWLTVAYVTVAGANTMDAPMY